MNVWISFGLYLVYRFIRYIIHGVQDLICFLNGITARLIQLDLNPTLINDCQVLTILYRCKLVEGDLTSPHGFVWWHEKFVNAKDVLAPNSCWTLFTMDNLFVYFVLTPKPWNYYNVRRAPFVLLAQFDDATKLARMPLRAFCRFADINLKPPSGPVVFYSNAARTGSTLLSRVMQVSDSRITCFGEPDAFNGLTICHQRGLIEDEALALDLIKGFFSFYCKTQEPRQTYLFKVASNVARIVPLVKQAVPEVRHMFTYRRNTRRVLSSAEKMIRGSCEGDVFSVLWQYVSPQFACRMINSAACESEMFRRFARGRFDCLDQAIILHVASYYYYYRCRDVFDLPLINYEDMVERKEETLKQVFELCELPYDEFIGEALREFGNDSQGGTMLSRDKMSKVMDTPLDEEKIGMMHEMCDALGVPRLEV